MGRRCAPRTIVLTGNRCPAYPIPLAVLRRTDFITYYSNTTGRCVSHKRAPSIVINSNSSLSARCRGHFSPVVRRVPSRRAGSRAGTIQCLRGEKFQEVTVIKTANGQRSRALKGVDLLLSCVGDNVRMQAVASCKMFIPTGSARAFTTRPKRRVSVVGFKTGKLRKRKLICPLDSFAG